MTDCQQAALCLSIALIFVFIMFVFYHVGKCEGEYQSRRKQRAHAKAEEDLRTKISEEAMKQLKALQKELNGDK